LAFFFCHPEPGPELSSGSKDFGISVLGLENLGFKAPPCGRGNLLDIFPLRPLTKILTKRLKNIAKYWEYSKITGKATGNRAWRSCPLGEREG
jgi:hypothetical protein